MKASILTSSAALNGLTPLRWLAFAQAATNAFAALAASFAPATLAVYPQAGGGRHPNFAYQFGVAGSLPPWLQPGFGVRINASVTVAGRQINLSSDYLVKSVDPGGTFFTVNAPSPSGARDAGAFSQSLDQTPLDGGASVSLVMQCQKAMVGCSSGAVVIAPVVDAAGNAPNAETVAAGQEYEITAPPGAKFDLGDWSVKTTSEGTLYVRFL